MTTKRSTGLPALDQALNGGIEPGSVTWITGRPASGKSKLLNKLLDTLAGPATLFDVEKLHTLTIGEILDKATDAQAWTQMEGAPILFDNISMAKLTPGTTYAGRTEEQRLALLRLADTAKCAVICTAMAPRDSMPAMQGLMKITNEIRAADISMPNYTSEHFVHVQIGRFGSFESVDYVGPAADFETVYEASAGAEASADLPARDVSR